MWKWIKKLFKKKRTRSIAIPSTPQTSSGGIINRKKYDWKNKDWDKMLHDAIIENGLNRILPSDAKQFNFTEDRIESWMNVFKAMAYFESGYKESKTYKENFRDRHGNKVISTGLFQVSVESLNLVYRYKVNQSELKTAEKNIFGAVKIMARWVKSDGVISAWVESDSAFRKGKKKYKGGARYWSILRDYHPDKLKGVQLANKTD